MATNSSLRLALLAVAALVAVAYPIVSGSSGSFLTIVWAKALPVLGIILLLQAGQVSFGHAMFFAVGAYTIGFVGRAMAGGELVLLLVAAAFASLLAGLLVGVFVVRYRYIFFGMLNLAFSMVLFSMLEKFIHVTGGSDGLRIARPTILGEAMGRAQYETILYYVSLAILALALYGGARFLDSPLGHALKAIKSNETRVEYLGISARLVLLVAYVASAVLAGLGGALVGAIQGIATPDYAYWVRSGEFVFVAILGGTGHVAGALAGAFVYEFIRSSAAAYVGDTWQMTLGIVLLAVILFAPRGIVGMAADLWGRLTGGSARAEPAPEEADAPDAPAREPRPLRIVGGGR
ncbi:branched-chain amino acid transport system permease protein [Chelatococcus caeni]|uniref:Branched-chain amino acid transport system permease protein n=1 Tax=Chelatococcus caeni TaxID=1348468 RepID=A0A840C0I7_9HYPH|nr:branched-chain amino acid ABC transporter permease [Chelatococcus caeni]MBB4018994.1 branched-chain amino acid transport system permease protein [Chelatococcus caeni]